MFTFASSKKRRGGRVMKLCAKFILQQYDISLQAIISENYMHVIPDAIKLGFICITTCI